MKTTHTVYDYCCKRCGRKVSTRSGVSPLPTISNKDGHPEFFVPVSEHTKEVQW